MYSRTLVLEIGIGLVVAEFLGEVVVQLGENALFDGLDFNVVGHGFAGELGFGVVGRIDHFELQLLAGLGAAQGVGEGFDRSLPPISTSVFSPPIG